MWAEKLVSVVSRIPDQLFYFRTKDRELTDCNIPPPVSPHCLPNPKCPCGPQFCFLRTALTPFRMPDLNSSGMQVVYCTGMLKDQFSGRLIGLKCELSKSQPNLNTSSSQFDFIPPSPPHPQGALLKICL